nr:hypothetical protein [Candidatus Sigynarchaeota archaeon]
MSEKKAVSKKSAGLLPEVGKKYFMRTVTYHMVGVVTAVDTENRIVKLEQSSWVAESGRFHECIAKGAINECEFVGEAFINMDSITDFFPWNNELPGTLPKPN